MAIRKYQERRIRVAGFLPRFPRPVLKPDIRRSKFMPFISSAWNRGPVRRHMKNEFAGKRNSERRQVMAAQQSILFITPPEQRREQLRGELRELDRWFPPKPSLFFVEPSGL